MRIAIVSDVHGNLPALEAVLADLDVVRPDLVVHGGDLAFGGPHPAEVVERIRELGWPGVLGNTDAVLGDEPAARARMGGSLAKAAARSTELLGPERIAWLTGQPLEWRGEDVAVVHAVPGDCWPVIPHEASDDTPSSRTGVLRTGGSHTTWSGWSPTWSRWAIQAPRPTRAGSGPASGRPHRARAHEEEAAGPRQDAGGARAVIAWLVRTSRAHRSPSRWSATGR